LVEFNQTFHTEFSSYFELGQNLFKTNVKLLASLLLTEMEKGNTPKQITTDKR